MDSAHRYGHGHGQEKRETVSQWECIYTAFCTAIAPQSIHLFQSLLQSHCIFFVLLNNYPLRGLLYTSLATSNTPNKPPLSSPGL